MAEANLVSITPEVAPSRGWVLPPSLEADLRSFFSQEISNHKNSLTDYQTCTVTYLVEPFLILQFNGTFWCNSSIFGLSICIFIQLFRHPSKKRFPHSSPLSCSTHSYIYRELSYFTFTQHLFLFFLLVLFSHISIQTHFRSVSFPRAITSKTIKSLRIKIFFSSHYILSTRCRITAWSQRGVWYDQMLRCGHFFLSILSLPFLSFFHC